MNLCYDFQKWTIITFASIAITLIIGLVSIAYGQTMGSLEILDYCYEHASDSPNPVQDLIDKGFLSSSFKGETCLSVRQMYNEVENRIKAQLANLTAEQNKYDQYYVCANNQSTTYEECARILNGTK